MTVKSFIVQAPGSCWIQTLNIRILSWGFYHSATAIGQKMDLQFYVKSFNLLFRLKLVNVIIEKCYSLQSRATSSYTTKQCL
jgi:hypothetical protein